MIKSEKQRLKKFIEEYIPFDDLKEVGFWPKGIRRTDYEKIAARVCQFFKFNSIYEYNPPDIEIHDGDVATGSGPSSISPNGELVSGGGFLLCLAESEFICPICTCPQSVNDHKRYQRSGNPYGNIKCKGCKRKLSILTGLSGKITIEEA